MSVNKVEDPEISGAPKSLATDNSANDQLTQEAEESNSKAASEPKVEVDASLQTRLQILNVLTFIIQIALSGSASKIMNIKLSEISSTKNLTIMVEGWALSIWAIIYLLIAVFVVYQALPNKWVPDRNNELIFGQIKYIFAVNMILNGSWLIVQLTNTNAGFGFSFLIIALMTATQTFIMMKSTRAKLNLAEIIIIRCGFTLYTGWVAAATIINAATFLNVLGMKNPNAGFDESTWTVIMLYVALVIYVLASFMERNPLFGAVYIWAVSAIRAKQTAYSDIQTNSLIDIIIMIVALVGITALSVYEKKEGKAQKGLFY